jgi:hypothetical protein
LVLFAVLTIGFAYAANGPTYLAVPVKFQLALIYLVFAAAAVAVFVRGSLNAVGLFLILSLGLFYFSGFDIYVIAANLLVTIVHVFLFTGAFILLGALKSKSWVGLLSLAVFVGCAIATMTVAAPYAMPGDRIRQLYSTFEFLNKEMLWLTGRPLGAVYEAAGVGVMRLIAFAYLYHYLNWFSKTSIIKWHEITRTRAVVIAGVWLAGGLAYLFDYRLGFGILYIMSMLHVFLEFPLNHQTMVEIGRSLKTGRWWAIGSQRGLSPG